MFLVKGGNIYIHRGDSASFDVVFGDVDNLQNNQISISEIYGIDWIPEDGTRITFSVKNGTDRPRCVIEKKYFVFNGFCTFDLLPKDTKYLPFGEYQWDIRLGFENADMMEINTPINPFPFYVTEVVGNGS